MGGKAGRPPKISEEDRLLPVAIVRLHPSAMQPELKAKFERRTGMRAHERRIRKALIEAGFDNEGRRGIPPGYPRRPPVNP